MIKINIQRIATSPGLPDNQHIRKWARAALSIEKNSGDRELTIRIVDETEGTQLNRQWRNGKGPTNVLSFPAGDIEKYSPGLLGDIVLCAPVIVREAHEQNKTPESHWAHMVIHGTLHLLDYDHLDAEEAEKMEALEIQLLESLGHKNPYYCETA